MKFKLIVSAAVALAGAIFPVFVTHAATLGLTYTGTDFSISATLDASSLGADEYHVTGLTGTVSEREAITLIPGGPQTFVTPPVAGGFFNLNNVLYFPPSGGLYFDGNGLGFTAFGAEWNLCATAADSCPGTYSLTRLDSSGFTGDLGSVSVTAVPERPAWALMGLGFVGLVLARVCGRRSTAAMA
jgi:hypothetical protein